MSRIQQLKELLESNPEDPFLLFALAKEYEKGNITLQALLIYEVLVNDHPEYIATYYHYGKLLLDAGNRNEGIRLLERGIEMGTQIKEAHAVSEMKSLLGQWKSSWAEDE